MARLTDKRIAEIEALWSNDRQTVMDHIPDLLAEVKALKEQNDWLEKIRWMHNEDAQFMLDEISRVSQEVKALRAEKAQAEAERDVLITLLNSGRCPYSYGYELPDCVVQITEGEESHCTGHSATEYSCWLKYAQQQAEKEGE